MRPLKRLITVLAFSIAMPMSSAIAQDDLSDLTPAELQEHQDILAAAQAIYAPYSDVSGIAGSAWDMPIYSAELEAKISRWEAGIPDGELEDLNSFDWLCECQDYDAAKFRAEFYVLPARPGRMAAVDVGLNLGWDDPQLLSSRVVLTRENGRWLISDLFSETFPVGLAKELDWAIEDHEVAE